MANTIPRELVDTVKAIKPLPAAVRRLCALADNPDVDVREITEIISADAALTARILRVANSAFYGLSQRIATVTHAFPILGAHGVRNIALAASVLDFHRGADLPIDLAELWKHSAAVATAARLIALCVGIKDPEEAFVCGLLHNIGRVVLAKHFNSTYGAVLDRAHRDNCDLYRVESREFGANDAEVGHALCVHWKLPESLCSAVARHHDPLPDGDGDANTRGLRLALHTADSLVKLVGIGDSGNQQVSPDFIRQFREHGVADGHIRQVVAALPEEMRKWGGLFDLPAGRSAATPAPSGEQPPVAVMLNDAVERELVSLVLLGMGYGLIAPPAAADSGPPLATVLDSRCAPEDAERTRALGRTVIDSGACRELAGIAGGGSVNAAALRTWFAGAIGRPSQERACS